ncbi:YhgE/Pip domain-containing protein [Lentilactobacillus otakiensis]|uniref:Phage infection protein n=1 Tax=Lentilactobacillus otakiensis DSM 19908 = JCM 15040 TaxID=1423780 RepID=S4NRK0_9LACO|nr:YhgE/Pip domain-containing protein [Lentilactobacillus otakiensis]KRL09836.1 YhgE Pip N-terminal domain-containing protein [Lentilactobacillus otakiensis DSM 19908 = JCM 15040]MBZ3776180.1 YhgE/Pip domain-containing protein [Lentilactobacillus otakiensis]MDV3517187.1 YhgE/Pip domain-containing protein [Lentilactobacillus otakiensis]GAD16573.1 phage infection protein [Lentilactobacillus otakiensis DSM 19908 = JCM 15040]
MFKNIKLIYQRDLKSIFKYKAALLTITALCFLPCLYTLVNVKAIWNPYTSQEVSKIPVAVVNNDQGTTVQGKQMNLGNQIIAQLKHNNQIGWRFVDAKPAQKKVRAGKYYAEIRIPKNFSTDLGSIISSNPKKAHIDYIADTKASPMSYKITEAASKTLLNTIKKQFVYQVNSTIFSYLNIAGKKAGDNESEILNLKDLIINLGDSMELATNTLGDISETSSGLAMVFSELKPVIATSQDVNINQAIGSSNKDLIQSVNHSVNQSFGTVQTSLNSVQTDAKRLQTQTDQLSKMTSATSRGQANSLAGQIRSQIQLLRGQITPLISYLQTINKNRHLAGVTNLISQLNDVKNILDSQSHQVSQLERSLSAGNTANANALHQISSQSYSTVAKLNHSLSSYNQQVKSELNGIQQNLMSASSKASGILNNVNDIQNLNEKSLDTVISGNKLVSSSTGDLENQLLQYKGVILQASNQLKLTSDNNIADIISILQNNPKLMGNALAQPFNVKNENIYRVSSFGEAFAPTYMALSIWVGCAMLVAVLHTSAPKYHRFKNLRPREEYIGKMLLFNTLSMIQTMIIVFSTVFILRVHVESLFLMVMIGVVSSLTFSVIVYTMASVFGNLGKALAVMMVAFQLAGSGAIYPVQLNPLFLRIIQPIFPFSYSVSGFREAVGGPNVGTVVLDFFVLICMLIGGLIVGLFMKDFFKRVTARLLNDFTKSGIGQP